MMEVKTTSSDCAIDVLCCLFAKHGVPDLIVGDSGRACYFNKLILNYCVVCYGHNSSFFKLSFVLKF